MLQVKRGLCGVFLFLVLGFPGGALASFGMVLPDRSVIDDPEQDSVQITLGVVEPFFGQGIPLEYPQAFTALRYTGDTADRSEHLSVLEESTAYGARAWTTRITLPHPGAYHFTMQSKAGWIPEQDSFIQYFAKVEVPVHGSSEGWDKSTGAAFEIVPLTRPFGLCEGMAFTGQVLLNGKPVVGTIVDAAALTNAVPIDIPVAEEETADTAKKTQKAFRRPVPLSTFQPVQQVKTDSNGLFMFVCPTAGWWAFAATTDGDPLKDPSGSLKPLKIRTLFWVYIDPCKQMPPKKEVSRP